MVEFTNNEKQNRPESSPQHPQGLQNSRGGGQKRAQISSLREARESSSLMLMVPADVCTAKTASVAKIMAVSDCMAGTINANFCRTVYKQIFYIQHTWMGILRDARISFMFPMRGTRNIPSTNTTIRNHHLNPDALPKKGP